MEVRCRRRDVEAFASRGLEVRCRRRDVEVFASRGLEVCCGPGDVEVFASRDLELRRHAAAGLETWRSGCAARMQMWKQRDLEIWSSGGILWAWGRGGT